MGSEWLEVRLSNAVDLIGGGTPKRSIPEYWGGTIPWLSVKNFNHDYRHMDSAEESITELSLAKSSTKLLLEGQLIISARGTVGALAQLSKPMAFNQSCYGINAKAEYATNDFLYYLLKYSIANLKQITHGAVFDTITRETFDHIIVNLPPLPKQRASAHILGSLDDKIELNRRMNTALEAMARTIFKSWFVDFDPVPAKAEVNSFHFGNSSPGGQSQRQAEAGILQPRYHHRSIRLKGYDYSQAGAYFVTICTQNRECLFGEIVDKEMILNDPGRMVEKWYRELENKFADIVCDQCAIMPNHSFRHPNRRRGRPACLP